MIRLRTAEDLALLLHDPGTGAPLAARRWSRWHAR